MNRSPRYRLGGFRVVVERHELPQSLRCEPFSNDRIRRAIPFEYAVWNKPPWSSFGLDLLRRFAESQRLGLGANVGDQDVVMTAYRIERLRKSNEVARDEPSALMDQLVKRMLTVGPRFAPINGAGLMRYLFSFESHVFAVALHRQLLQVCWKAFQVLFVG